MFPSALAQLIHKLRHANARHSTLALQHRARLHHTHHAKRRAYWAGLRIDVHKARDCPSKYISRQPLPVVESTPLLEEPPFLVPSMEPTHPLALEIEDIPEILVSPPTSNHGHVPPSDLVWEPSQLYGDSIPGAPLLKPMQLPDDDTHMIEAPLDDSPPSSDSSLGGLFTPAHVHSGLRIIIPPRSLKRKLKELESDDPHLDIQLHKQMVGDPWPGIEELQRAPMLM